MVLKGENWHHQVERKTVTIAIKDTVRVKEAGL